ncbi:heparinase II/III domain-containing protein [Pedobacter punctiformis]|uniref:Heparinase II/III family protein n=1 Tax=Pedobacter punctiformis TaxID=3004097 RepID=A0ABT4LC81_9SPHI|nr:heparinase II/III family protein [Pedobacter sp. HCMS5-2]MCZ4245530.1 heparinase II/III family protein [Pedobacter sp. HCMS5-2]
MAQTTVKRNWLFNAYQQVYPTGNALPELINWQQKQQTAGLKAIAILPDSTKEKLIHNAERANNYKWPSLPSSLYLDYKLTGTRVNYENLQGERRKMLSHLVIGELVDNKGKYIPQIVNGLWLLLEESTWVAPAHIVMQKEGADLANIENPYIDLNASRTALTVASIYSMLSPKFAAYSKVINGRILYELNRRIFDPYLKYDHFWWMGFKDNPVNNWNTYVNANSLQAALLVLKPGAKLDSLTAKLLKSTDNFINQYPEDGGCDEGPSYWDMAGGRLIQLMLILNQASEGKLDWSNKELLHRIGTYTYKMQIAGNYNVNFADANALYTQNPESVYEYGLMFKDKTLQEYASFLFKERKNQIPADDISDFLASAGIYNDLKNLPASAPYPQYSVLPDLQVFNARLKEGETKGLFFAAKGGNNAESHNHNDIGNFIVYADGKPALIDAGVGTYTAKTFSDKRYELWNVQSQWHNCPTINGVNQQDGKKFAASDFKYSNTNTLASVSMDIAHAYPAAAQVKKWNRSITLNRLENEISLADVFTLNAYKAPTELNFLTPYVAEQKKGELYFKEAGITMSFDVANFEVNMDEKPMDDIRIAKIWGEKLYRIRLTSKNKNTSGTYKILIRETKFSNNNNSR